MDPPEGSPYRRVDRTRIGRLLAVVLAGGFALLATSGAASANGPPTVYGFNTTDGHFVLPFVQNLFSTDPVTPGSLVFGDSLYLIVSPVGHNSTITITASQAVESGSGPSYYTNETAAIDPHNFTVVTFVLAPTSDERNVLLCVDGGCMRFAHVTPVTLLPSGLLNIGGEDILALSIVVETATLLFPLIILARSLTRRALFSPRFRAWLWAPHFLLGFLLLIAVDFRDFDRLFGGWSFAIYPVVFDAFLFAWCLHLFNVAKPVEVLRPDPQGGHSLRYNRWRVWMGKLPDGRHVLIGTKWRDWVARLFGHYTVVSPARTDAMRYGAPSESALVTWRKDAVRGEREDDRTRRFRSRSDRETPLDDFILESQDPREKDPPSHLYWVDSDRWLDAKPPHLSMHRIVDVPPKLDAEGHIVVPATTKRRLTWPHYVDPPAQASLAGIHYLDTPVAAMGWIRAERAYRRLEEVRLALNAVRVSLYNLADDSTVMQVDEIYRLLDRQVLPLTDEEAKQETRREPPHAPRGPRDKPDDESEPRGGRP
jgi:hypothetical protein